MRNHRRDALNELRARQNRDPFFDTWERDFDKNFNRLFKAGFVVWGVGIVLTIAFWVVVIWAIIQGVQWLQTQ